jgi:hypothetical protein
MTKEEQSIYLERVLVKLIITMQVQLELFDELQLTKAYRHNIKKSTNMLSKDLEEYLREMYGYMKMDKEKEESFLAIKRGVEMMLKRTVDELYDDGFEPINE